MQPCSLPAAGDTGGSWAALAGWAEKARESAAGDRVVVLDCLFARVCVFGVANDCLWGMGGTERYDWCLVCGNIAEGLSGGEDSKQQASRLLLSWLIAEPRSGPVRQAGVCRLLGPNCLARQDCPAQFVAACVMHASQLAAAMPTSGAGRAKFRVLL